MTDTIETRNKRLLIKLLLLVIGMFGFGYALVPIYDVFCEITGINGKTEAQAIKEVKYQVDENRWVTVEFLTALNESAPMEFRAETKKMQVHPGAYHTVNFYAENKTGARMIARAIPSISPGAAAEYFKKTQCFCFNEQTFEPNEGKTMPVRFVVLPDLPDQYKTITLAYTFFDNTEQSLKK